MSQHDDFDRSLARWFDAEAHPSGTADVLDRALHATRRRRPRPRSFAALGSDWVGDSVGPTSGVATLGRTGVRTSMALLLLLLVLALVAGAVLVGALRLQPAPPVSPAAGELELQLQTWGLGLDPSFVEVAVYADGQVIWDADDQRGYVEQWLTLEGVEQLRSRAMSTGLFERELALGIDDVGWGNIKVRRGDLSVTVAWGETSQEVSGLGLEDRFIAATSAQAADVTELEAYLRDPTAWDLPDDMYAQREITLFVPSQFWVGFDRSVPNLSNLPSPAREVVAGILEPLFGGQCQNISFDQAREIAQVLARAGIIAPDYDVRVGFAFYVPASTSFVHAHPVLPHDVGTVCGQA